MWRDTPSRVTKMVYCLENGAREGQKIVGPRTSPVTETAGGETKALSFY